MKNTSLMEEFVRKFKIFPCKFFAEGIYIVNEYRIIIKIYSINDIKTCLRQFKI